MMMSPVVLSMLAFLGVMVVFGLLAFVFREQGPQTATRLDLLVGKRTRQEAQQADILRKSAFEGDKKSLLEALTPKFLSPQKLFEQADCHIKPSTLFGIGLLLAGLGATGTVLARLPLFLVPVNVSRRSVAFWLPLSVSMNITMPTRALTPTKASKEISKGFIIKVSFVRCPPPSTEP